MSCILVADDDDAVRGVIKAVLERAGYEVVPAANGVAALEAMKSRPIDLVLLDIEMPGLNGYDVCGLIQTDPRLRFIPVVMMTGRPVLGVPERVHAVGAKELIHKPFDRANLLAKIKLYLDGTYQSATS